MAPELELQTMSRVSKNLQEHTPDSDICGLGLPLTLQGSDYKEQKKGCPNLQAYGLKQQFALLVELHLDVHVWIAFKGDAGTQCKSLQSKFHIRTAYTLQI